MKSPKGSDGIETLGTRRLATMTHVDATDGSAESIVIIGSMTVATAVMTVDIRVAKIMEAFILAVMIVML